MSSGELYSVMRFFVYEDFEDEIFNIEQTVRNSF